MAIRNSIKYKVLLFSVVLFLAILIVGSLTFAVSMREITSSSKGIELQKMLEVERIKLEASVNGVIAIALKMAGCPLIQRYFANPEDKK
jgi:sensor histidine kinase regulating citrate/malate metabolism